MFNAYLIDQRLDRLALAELAANVVGDALLGRAAHVKQSLADALLGEDIEVRRLFELGCRALLEGAIADRISGGVDEIPGCGGGGNALSTRNFKPIEAEAVPAP